MEEIAEQQRALWNKASGGWKKWDGFVMGWLEEIGGCILEKAVLKDDSKVLDVATGTGEPGITAARRMRKGEVTGTDISEEMIKIANEKARLHDIKNYEGIVCDTSALPFEENYFDAVICRQGVMFFPDIAKCLKEMARVMKPGGRMALSAWASPEENPWATTFSGMISKILGIPLMKADAHGSPFRCSQPGNLSLLLKQAGLHDTNQMSVEGMRAYDSPARYWQLMTEVSPLAAALAKAPEEKQEEVKSAVTEAAKKYIRDERLCMHWGAWVAWGVK